MADTFAIREENSDTDIPQIRRGVKKQIWERGLDLWEDRGPRPQYRPANVKLHEMMDFYTFCSAFLLWSTAVVLAIFSGYILMEEYGVAVLNELDLFAYTMVLQVLAAVVNLFAAGITTSLIRLDDLVPRRAVLGGAAVLSMTCLLIAVSVVGAFAKREIRGHDMHELLGKRDEVPSDLSDVARSLGTKCETWQDSGCRAVYKRHVIIYTNYLIGSALVGVGITLCVLPVFLLVYVVIRRELQKDGQILAISSRLDTVQRNSFLPVKNSFSNGEGLKERTVTTLEDTTPDDYGKEHSSSTRLSKDAVK